MAASPPIIRASSYQGPSSLAEVLWSPDALPSLSWVLQDSTGTLSTRSSLAVGGKLIAPPSDTHNLLSKGIILLPTLVGEALPTVVLLGRIQSFIHSFCDLPSLWESIVSHYILMTWVYDRFSAVPYLRFLGEPQSGKTRCLQAASQLCYKSVVAGGSTSSSALFRLLDVWRGTFCIDEADYSKSDLYADIIKILNQGYTSGLCVIKSEKDKQTFDPRGFEVFGPKILTTRKPFEDSALESRCLTFQTGDSPISARIPRQLPPSFFSEAQEIRNLCLAWRFSNFFLIDGDQSALLALAPRLTQIAVPIWAVSEDPEFRASFLSFLKGESIDQRSSTPLSVVAEALGRQAESQGPANGAGGPGAPPAWSITISDLAESAATLGGEWGSEVKFTPKTTGSLLRSLGLQTFKGKDGCYQFILFETVLRDIQGRHKNPS